MPVTYATETYKEVLRWLDNTPIAYAPNPKLKGSKSHVRYAKYAKAKTVGEALRKGSYYLDLLFDHQHGYLRATGGPKRKELVSPDKKKWDDTWTSTDKVLSTMHAKWILWTNTFKLADRLGVDRRNLTANKMSGISVEMHAMRMEAQAMAQLILEEADKSSLPVTDEDMTRVLKLWAWKQNSSRQNVMPDGVDWVRSDTLGLLGAYDGTVLVNNSTKYYPAVPKLMNRWLQDHLPPNLKGQFAYTSINVNRGYAAKLHRDGNNEGPSMIAAFGEFSGGLLQYWGEDDKTLGPVEKFCREEDALSVDLKKNLLLFDGNRGHAVGDFEGDRFTLVFFSISRSWKASGTEKKQLADADFPFPDAQGLAKNKKLLTPPLGYGKNAKQPGKGERHTSRCWPRTSKRKPVVDRLTPKQVAEAMEAAKRVEPPVEDDDSPPDTVFVSQQQDRRLNDEGLKWLRIYLKGESGRLYLAVEGLERRKGTGAYNYRKAESFTAGPPLETVSYSEMINWVNGMIKKRTKKERMAEQAPTRADKSAATPAKKRKAGEEGEQGTKRRRLSVSRAALGTTAKPSPAKTPKRALTAAAVKSPAGKPARPARKVVGGASPPKRGNKAAPAGKKGQ